MIELVIFGIVTGLIAGFFGVGGGMLLIPMLLISGFEMKQAVSISVIQMVFTSVYGTFLNYKKYESLLKDGILLGIGGFLGGLQSGIIHTLVSNTFLQYIFIGIILFAIYSVSKIDTKAVYETKRHNKVLLIIIGFSIGIIAMSIGVGGAIMLTPILAYTLHYNLKTASSLGLFFVVFSSIAGLISQSVMTNMLYFEGIVVGIASLIGVYIGIYIKNKTHINSYKKYILILYITILIASIYKL